MTAQLTHPFTLVLESHFCGHLRCGGHSPNGEGCALEVASIARWYEQHPGEALTADIVRDHWSDDPARVGLPDLRPINDAFGDDDAARSAAMIPTIMALWEWPRWTPVHRKAWAQRVADRTIREIVPLALRAAVAVHPDPNQRYALNAAADLCELEGGPAKAAVWAAEAAVWAAEAAEAGKAGKAAKAAAKAAVWAAEAGKAAKAAAKAAEAAVWAAEAAVWAAEAAAKAAEAAVWAAEAAVWAAEAAEAAEAAGSSHESLVIACRIWREEATDSSSTRTEL